MVQIRPQQVHDKVHVPAGHAVGLPVLVDDVLDADHVVVLEVQQKLQLSKGSLRRGDHLEGVHDLLDGHVFAWGKMIPNVELQILHYKKPVLSVQLGSAQ